MKNFILFFALLLASLSATAANQYVCKCDAGASAACAANVGSNSNSGTSASSPKLDLPTSVSGFSGNDTLYLCTGGSWVTSTGFVNSTNFGATTPFKINWYAPTQGCDVSCANTKPIISCTAADCTVINYGIGGAASNKNGFAISNVELSCKGASGVTAGVGISGDSNYFTLNNFNIHDCGFGVISTGYLASQGSTDGNNDYLTFTNGTVYNNKSEGMFFDGGYTTPIGMSTHVLIEGVTFDSNGWSRATFDHQLYFNGGMDLNIRGNKFVNGTNNGGNGCGAVELVVHGYVRRLTIEDNLIQETAAALGGCYGIQVNAIANNIVPDNIADVVIRGNRLVNVGSIGIALTGCLRCVMEDNFLVWTQSAGLDHVGIAAQPSTVGNDPDTLGGMITMRNNSCYIAGATNGSQCYQNRENGAGHVMASNVAYFDSASSASAACFDYGSHASGEVATGSNSCFRAGGATFSNLGNIAATQRLGFDATSITSDPTLTATPSAATNWEIRFSNGSLTNAGHATLSSRLGYHGKPAVGGRDVGACEFNGPGNECNSSATSVPSSPNWATIQ